MIKLVIYLIIFLAVILYGIYYYRTADKEIQEFGMVDGKGLIIGQTEPEQRYKSQSTVDWRAIVRFTHNGVEQTVNIHAGGATRDLYSVGKEVDLIIYTRDFEKTQIGSLAAFKRNGMIIIGIGLIGFLVFAVRILLGFIRN